MIKEYFSLILAYLYIKTIRVIYFITNSTVYVDDHLIIFESFHGNSISDSPLAIYNYLSQKEEFSKFKFVWVVDNINLQVSKLNNNSNTKYVEYKSKDYYKYYAKAKYWVINCRIPLKILKRENQVCIQCWHGTPLKKLGSDVESTIDNTVGKLTRNYIYSKQAQSYNYFLSQSKYASDCFRTAFSLSNEQILELGYPRCDELVLHKDDWERKNSIKERLNIDRESRVILYAPTYRDEQFNTHNNKDESTSIVLSLLSALSVIDEKTTILYRGHYFTKSTNVINVKDVSNIDNVNDILLISDILITDYSSIFFDFSLLDRPIIHYLFDHERYSNETRGMYKNIDSSFGTKIVYKESEVINYISLCFECSCKRNDFLREYLPNETGNVTIKLIDMLFNEDVKNVN
ncbi:CDP-glycerol glycerophosphotransferase family protein [Vibrio breoganii]